MKTKGTLSEILRRGKPHNILMMKRTIFAVIVLLSGLIAFPATAAVTVQTKDLDGPPTGQNMRRLGFLLTNVGDAPVDMADVSVEYEMAGGKTLGYQIWYYVVHSVDWSIQGGPVGEVRHR